MADVDRRVFRDLSYGLYIITSCDGERLNGQLANTVIQVTSDPPRIAVILNKKNLTHEFIAKSGVFAVFVKNTPQKKNIVTPKQVLLMIE